MNTIVICLLLVGGYTSPYEFTLVDGTKEVWQVKDDGGAIHFIDSNQCLIKSTTKPVVKKDCTKCHGAK